MVPSRKVPKIPLFTRSVTPTLLAYLGPTTIVCCLSIGHPTNPYIVNYGLPTHRSLILQHSIDINQYGQLVSAPLIFLTRILSRHRWSLPKIFLDVATQFNKITNA
ncbi:hypothetical protein Zmor_014432 [Zophobas morio]|uniref:Uncharacterized protein n=1 Tax=Zophobas morio TaxID=2755281 RepID=A0AA38MG46_9CUCU|nr:hypothetical protein Zmor_014432 [Zophobas morio]